LKVAGLSFYYGTDIEGRRQAAQALVDYRHRELMRWAEEWEAYILPSTMVMLRSLKDTYSRYLGLLTTH
jgi:hypothetical protein